MARTHAHTHTVDISPYRCSAAEKKVFHYLNLSNSENIKAARWICSRSPRVLLSEGNFCSIFPYFEHISLHFLLFRMFAEMTGFIGVYCATMCAHIVLPESCVCG